MKFPDIHACHTLQQVFYFDQNGLLTRLDYELDISGGTSMAHYVFDYKDFQGLKLPTRRFVYLRDKKRNHIKEPVFVKYDLWM